ncbi:hypothetical protein G6F31_018101 [Rhizopus arrhizus]|nr:hypothetical protein G6F31_018101 [Rhizopus arrhizus]
MGSAAGANYLRRPRPARFRPGRVASAAGVAAAERAGVCRHVLRRVRLAEWAERNGGLQAWVGENGATMSAGQARRLALARALLRNAPILLLDEPTEGLDVDTARALLQDLSGLLDGRSLLMITHDDLPDGVVDAQYRLRDGVLIREP